MPEQVPFIGKQKELNLIDELINKSERLPLIFIGGEGGIGKSRLLRKVHNNLKTQHTLLVADVIDFDDLNFRIFQHVNRKIAKIIGENSFYDYLKIESEYYQNIQKGVNYEQLEKKRSDVNEKFIECFNRFSSEKKIALFFDTTDHFDKEPRLWDNLRENFVKLENVIVFMSGRNAERIGKSLKTQDKYKVEFIKLEPFTDNETEEYLTEKEARTHVKIEPELKDKLIRLSCGKPILIDLAVELRSRGLASDLLRIEGQEEFQRQLVIEIKDIREPMHSLILAMAHVYPLKSNMIEILLELQQDEAKELYQDAKTYVFVKILPDNSIMLHDEMRRMIKQYVFKDELAHRLIQYSKTISQYFFDRIEQLEEQQGKTEEQDLELGILKRRYLHHVLFFDKDEGIKTFVKMFDQIKLPFFHDQLFSRVDYYYDTLSEEQKYQVTLRRNQLLDRANYYYNELTEGQKCIVNIKKSSLSFNTGKYEEVKKILENILNKSDILSEHRIESLILCANAEVRLGKVKEAIEYFKEAVKISKNSFPLWSIKSHNALGWAYRLTGDLESAFTHYRDAQNLCLNEMIRQTEKDKLRQLDEEYGLISNNLIFIMSTKRANHATAIDLALETIAHWKKTGNKTGLGRCYSALGIVYFRNSLYINSLDVFLEALAIFKELDLKSELGNTHSWRGATYLRMNNLDDAEKDFKESLTIGTINIKPMTLYRLGHLYSKKEQWERSEKYLRDSIEHAKTIPDFTYWLLSMARLCMLPTEEVIKRLDEVNEMLDDCRSKAENLPQNSLGLLYIGLSRLLLLQNDMNKKDSILNFLKEGITLTIEHGSSAHTGILVWLELFEKDFDKINSEIIRLIGIALIDYVAKKEISDLTYMKIKPKLYQWTKWDRKING